MQATLTPGGTAATHGTMTQIALKASPVMTWRRTAIGWRMVRWHLHADRWPVDAASRDAASVRRPRCLRPVRSRRAIPFS